ncbi:hypothetical protein CR513_04109, partial [Mucuna pruriens]
MFKVDKLTSIHSRGEYARFCVEVDLSKRQEKEIYTKYGIDDDSVQNHEGAKSLVIVDEGKEETMSNVRVKGNIMQVILNLVKNLKQNYDVNLVFLLETRINGLQAQQIIQRMNFSNQFIQDPIEVLEESSAFGIS